MEKASVIDSGKHGIYNGDTFYGESITVTNAGDLLLSNGGEMMKITGITLGGKANKAIYNSGYAELYSLTVDGTDVISITVDDQEFPFETLGAVVVLGKNKINLYAGKELLQLKGSKRFNALKYVHFFHKYKNWKSGDINGKFLGL